MNCLFQETPYEVDDYRLSLPLRDMTDSSENFHSASGGGDTPGVLFRAVLVKLAVDRQHGTADTIESRVQVPVCELGSTQVSVHASTTHRAFSP
jgi:hypothetical protein